MRDTVMVRKGRSVGMTTMFGRPPRRSLRERAVAWWRWRNGPPPAPSTPMPLWDVAEYGPMTAVPTPMPEPPLPPLW